MRSTFFSSFIALIFVLTAEAVPFTARAVKDVPISTNAFVYILSITMHSLSTAKMIKAILAWGIIFVNTAC